MHTDVFMCTYAAITQSSVLKAMGSHHSKVALLVLDEKQDCVDLAWKKLKMLQNDLAYHPGLVSPPSGDGSPFAERKFADTMVKRVTNLT